jgi:hypothetical protein
MAISFYIQEICFPCFVSTSNVIAEYEEMRRYLTTHVALELSYALLGNGRLQGHYSTNKTPVGQGASNRKRPSLTMTDDIALAHMF